MNLKVHCLFALCAAVIAAAAHAACPTAQFAFAKAVVHPDAATIIASLTLDTDVFSAVQEDFSDLRLADDQGIEAPCRVVRGTAVGVCTQRFGQEVKIISAAPTGAAFEVVFELVGKNPAVNMLNLATPLKDFEKSVDVFSSDDGTAWTQVSTNAVVFDYTRFMDVSNHDIKLPGQVSCRYLKLVVREVADDVASSLRVVSRETRAGAPSAEKEETSIERRAFRMDNVSAWRDAVVQGAETNEIAAYPVHAWVVTNNAADKTTLIELRVQRVPLTAISLEASSVNFSRSIELQVPSPADSPVGTPAWQTIHHAAISRIRIGGFSQEQMRLEFPEQRSATYRLVIRNFDNPPIAITDVRAWGNVYRIQFLPEQGKRYTLYYGAANINAPQYDISALLAGLNTGVKPVPWSLGPQQRNAAIATQPQHLAWLNSKVTLGTAIAAMVALLAWGIWHTSRKVGSTLQ